MESNKRCIINVGVDGWYKRGSDRLNVSLKQFCPDVGKMIYSGFLPPEARPHTVSNYGFKVYAFIEAYKAGYRQILWCDSSIYAIKDCSEIFDVIDRDGYYFINNGYKLSQTATDKLLSVVPITRDEVDNVPELTTCVFGFDFSKQNIIYLFEKWHEMERHGLFNGSRTHNPEDSQDPRFLFCRHDQSALTLAAFMEDIPHNAEYSDHVQYKMNGSVENIINGKVCLINHGM